MNMPSSELQRIYISVQDMSKSLAFFQELLGLQVVWEGDLGRQVVEQLWRLEGGTKAHAVILENGRQPTTLALVSFEPRAEGKIRPGIRITDYGHFDIAFIVEDLVTAYKEAKGRGMTFISEPVSYQPSWIPFAVKEVIVIAPDEVPIALIEIVSKEKSQFDRTRGLIGNTAQIVEDIDEALLFYRDSLGLKLLGDITLPVGLVNTVIGLPDDATVRMAFFNTPGSGAAVVELLQFSLKGTPIAEGARPPRCGIFMISFKTEDFETLIARIAGAHRPLVSGPVEYEDPVLGRSRAVILDGPNRELIEISHI